MKFLSQEATCESGSSKPQEAVAAVAFLEKILDRVKEIYDSLDQEQKQDFRVKGIEIDLEKGIATIKYDIPIVG